MQDNVRPASLFRARYDSRARIRVAYLTNLPGRILIRTFYFRHPSKCSTPFFLRSTCARYWPSSLLPNITCNRSASSCRIGSSTHKVGASHRSRCSLTSKPRMSRLHHQRHCAPTQSSPWRQYMQSPFIAQIDTIIRTRRIAAGGTVPTADPARARPPLRAPAAYRCALYGMRTARQPDLGACHGDLPLLRGSSFL
jgi:hypothetical protein